MKKKTNKERIYEYLQKFSSATTRDIHIATGITMASAAGTISSMRKEGLIRVTEQIIENKSLVFVYEAVDGVDMPKTNQEIVYEFLIDRGPANSREISSVVGFTPRVVANAASALVKRGAVEIVGSFKIAGATAHTYRAVEIRTGSDVSFGTVLERTVALGGGPFGLMAAQLGATA